MKREIFKILSYPTDSSNNQKSVYLHKNVAKSLNLKENCPYTLICGINSIPVQIKTIKAGNNQSNVLLLTYDILKEILIPEGISIEVIFTNRIIKIGPIIAVLTDNKYLQDYLKGTNVVEEYNLYADMAEKVHALVYVFSLRNLHPEDKYINGFLPVKENNKWVWLKYKLPMPDVICNRMAVAVNSPAYEKIKFIRNIVPDIKIINGVTKISKWKIAKLLQEDRYTKQYIPETRLFERAEDITEMLQKFTAIYLKPVRRSLGLGIIKMEKSTPDNYTAYYNVDGTNYKIKGDVNSILYRLRDVMGKRVYILQQGISVALYNKKPFDLRVTMQKDGSGEWSFSRCLARIAAPGNIVTNVAAGGKGVPAERVLGSIFQDRISKIMNEVVKSGFIISKALDKKINNIGDLGLDISVDINGKVYLFEVNFRAIKPSNINLRDAKAWFQTYYKPIYYLRYLYDMEMEKKYNPQP